MSTGQIFDTDKAILPGRELPLYNSTHGEPRLRFSIRYLFLTIIAVLGLLHVMSHHGVLPLPDCFSRRPQLVRSPIGNPAYLATILQVRHGAVASENRQCSPIGIRTMQAGGNAVDAAISTTFCIGVVNMLSSGIGGGGVMTIRIPPSSSNSNSSVYTIDFREAAPALASADMYNHDPESARIGGRSVAVPGEVLGLEEAHRRWGRTPWHKLVQPSVELARGWEVDHELAGRLRWFDDLLLRDPDWAAIYAPGGTLLRVGDIIKRTNYSNTLAKIASEGSKALYEGPIAESIIRKVQSTGGILTQSDLTTYRVQVKRALEGTYRGRKVYTTNAPFSGPALLHMLNLADHYDLQAEGRTPLNVHRIVEIMKFGFAARTNISDPAFTANMSRINNIPTKHFADAVFPKITDGRTHRPEYYGPVFEIQIDHGTSHTSVVDKDGMAVSLTSTINAPFGSQVMDPQTGIIFNDEMCDFSIPGVPDIWGMKPSPYNYPGPGKRPLSSMAPTIIEHEDGSLYLTIGGAGGPRILPCVFQVIINLDWGLDPRRAIEAGRLHDQLYPQWVDFEPWYSDDLLDGLRQRGHNLTANVMPFPSAVQVVVKRDGDLFAASDPRKSGVAAGY